MSEIILEFLKEAFNLVQPSITLAAAFKILWQLLVFRIVVHRRNN